MAKARATTDTPMRKCAGSTRFGIPSHEAPVTGFPAQPSGTDGRGRMCKPHWTEYTRQLRMASKAVGLAGERKPTVEAIALGKSQGNAARAAERNVNTSPRARTSKPPRPVDPEVARAAQVLDDTDQLGGKAYLDAIASDEVQDALRVMAGTREGPAVHESLRQKQYAEERGLASETPLGDDIDGDAAGLAVA